MCATVVEIINGKLLMMEGQNGITTYAPCHFMAGAKNVYILSKRLRNEKCFCTWVMKKFHKKLI